MDTLKNITVTNIINIITVHSSKGRYEKITNRRFFGLSFCIDGQITYTHKGKNYVSDKNHAVILPQGQSYTLFGNKKGVFPVINFTCSEHLCDTFTVIPIENAESFIKDFEQMKSLAFFDGNRSKIFSIFYNILHKLHTQNNTSSILAPALKYIESNYSSPNLSNALLAKECAVSEVYFRKLFTQSYKITPKQFILDIRISKAKQMLSEGILKINAISEKCGFSSKYHFCRIFKSRTGLTPTEYLKQNELKKI